MSLRAQILKHALPYLPEQSFTVRPLLNSLSKLPVNHPDRNETITPEVLDVIFGSELNARRELVKAWEEEGLLEMAEIELPKGRPEIEAVGEILARRLEYSSRIGEHLVEVCNLISLTRLTKAVGLGIIIIPIIIKLHPHPDSYTIDAIVNAPLNTTSIPPTTFPTLARDPSPTRNKTSILLKPLGNIKQSHTPLPNEPPWSSFLWMENS